MSSEYFEIFWPTFESTVQAQETYSFNSDMSYEQAYELWCTSPQYCYVALNGEQVLGSYYIKPNAMGPGSHVCNCGYMVSEEARGKGVAKSMCLHSQQVAIDLGYLAMQFNSVVSTNQIAVKLWKSLGYQIIGTVPNGFRHKKFGFVDSFIMHKALKSQ